MSDHSYCPGSSDDVWVPGFSQRDDNEEAVRAEIQRYEAAINSQQERRRQKLALARLEAEGYAEDADTAAERAPTPRPTALAAMAVNHGFYQPMGALDSQANSQEWLAAQEASIRAVENPVDAHPCKTESNDVNAAAVILRFPDEEPEVASN
ncbi:hypothetical protein DFH09DRAFT_1360603 [Mycena vulgaris]|nr:hypothetical protein DFH09DRAFT_1360603 [Mycena vulgaris]